MGYELLLSAQHKTILQNFEKTDDFFKNLDKNSEKNILSNKKILLVDDDIRNLKAISMVLKSKGIKINTEENGQKALDFLYENKDIDLLLIDIMMPIMDGYETMKVIRKDDEFKKLPIIALTAKAMKEDQEKCMRAGASDYLSKPVDMERLISLMEIWLSK